MKEWHEIAALERWRSKNIAHMHVKVHRRLQVCVYNRYAHSTVSVCVQMRFCVYVSGMLNPTLQCQVEAFANFKKACRNSKLVCSDASRATVLLL